MPSADDGDGKLDPLPSVKVSHEDPMLSPTTVGEHAIRSCRVDLSLLRRVRFFLVDAGLFRVQLLEHIGEVLRSMHAQLFVANRARLLPDAAKRISVGDVR